MPDAIDPTPGAPTMVAPLDNSARQILKGSLVPLRKTAGLTDPAGLVKYNATRQLALSPGESDAVQAYLRTNAPAPTRSQGTVAVVSPATIAMFKAFEQPIIPALRPGISAIASLPQTEVAAFAQALVEVRSASVRSAQKTQTTTAELGEKLRQLNAAVVATKSLGYNAAMQPLGMLNLERIEMVPAGIERGELVATIPLAPGEATAVTHKEWSVTSQEFTTIVTDSLESTSETGVTDNTDLSQSTTSQNQHSTQFNITGTVRGGIPIISGSSSAGVSAQDAGSQSATDSIKHASAVTQKAAARSRQEHKTTISTTTVTGTSETSTRVLKNDGADPIRIDYFSLMRKWRVRLYRYGLRLTYDLVIPEPGAAMRRAYMQLDALRQMQVPFTFDTKFWQISPTLVDFTGNPTPVLPALLQPAYVWQQDRYAAAVQPYPTDPAPLFRTVRGDGNLSWNYLDVQFNVPSGAQIKRIYLSALIGVNDGQWPWLRVLGARDEGAWQDQNGLEVHDAVVYAQDGTEFMAGATGDQTITFWLWRADHPAITLKIILENSSSTIEQWRTNVWNTLYGVAQNNYFAKQQLVAAQVTELQARLDNVDTLTLRREESDEIMKNILKFVLGPDFDLMPTDVQKAFAAEATDMDHGIAFDGQSLAALSVSQWSVLKQHEDIVRFINQAIEWENVVTFLYSYFWDLPQSWAFIRDLRHVDLSRQAFLRAGSARVVLTVRKGWETKWAQFVKDGTVAADIAAPATGPYLSIAQEIAAYDDRNYPGIPPANPARAAVRLQESVYTTCTSQVGPSAAAISLAVADSSGFITGLQVIIDVEDDRHIQEAVLITGIPDATHIVIAQLTHTHDGTALPFPILQPGEKGTLIAEWNEYTPSSGTDIAVTSNLTSIA